MLFMHSASNHLQTVVRMTVMSAVMTNSLQLLHCYLLYVMTFVSDHFCGPGIAVDPVCVCVCVCVCVFVLN